MKSVVFSLLILGFSPSLVWAQNSVGTEASAKSMLKFYTCSLSIMQKIKITTGDEFEKVVDKKTCNLDMEISVDEALSSAIESEKTAGMYNGIHGLKTKTKEFDGVYYVNRPQYAELKERLLMAKENKTDLSLYIMKHQISVDRRGFPDTTYLLNLEKAELKIEASK